MVTLQEFKDKNLRFIYNNKSYSYDDLQEFYEDAFEDLSSETDPTEFDIKYQTVLEKVKSLWVFKIARLKIRNELIKNYIIDFASRSCAIFDEDNDHFHMYFSDKAEDYLTKFLEEVTENNNIDVINKGIGTIDLSGQLEEYVQNEKQFVEDTTEILEFVNEEIDKNRLEEKIQEVEKYKNLIQSIQNYCNEHDTDMPYNGWKTTDILQIIEAGL